MNLFSLYWTPDTWTTGSMLSTVKQRQYSRLNTKFTSHSYIMVLNPSLVSTFLAQTFPTYTEPVLIFLDTWYMHTQLVVQQSCIASWKVLLYYHHVASCKLLLINLQVATSYFKFLVVSNSKLFSLDLPFNHLLWIAILNSHYFELFYCTPDTWYRLSMIDSSNNGQRSSQDVEEKVSRCSNKCRASPRICWQSTWKWNWNNVSY